MMTFSHLARPQFRSSRSVYLSLILILQPLIARSQSGSALRSAVSGATVRVAAATPVGPVASTFQSGGQSDTGVSAPSPLAPQAGSTQESAPIQLSTGDLLDVEVFDTPELSLSRARVSQDGLIRMPVVGDISILGLSPVQAAVKIEATLRDQQIMLDPHVTVLVNEYSSQGVRVLGQVKSPGTYTLLGQHDLEDALSAAGGTTADQGGTITITHANDRSHPEVLNVYTSKNSDLENRTQIRPGDVIIVSKAAPFYVTGDVGEPGLYTIGNGRPLHFLEGIALAHGVTATASVKHAAILRRTDTGTTLIPVNLSRVQHNTDPDPLIEADDILIVPHSGLKQIVNYAIPYAAGIVIGSAITRSIPQAQ